MFETKFRPGGKDSSTKKKKHSRKKKRKKAPNAPVTLFLLQNQYTIEREPSSSDSENEYGIPAEIFIRGYFPYGYDEEVEVKPPPTKTVNISASFCIMKLGQVKLTGFT